MRIGRPLPAVRRVLTTSAENASPSMKEGFSARTAWRGDQPRSNPLNGPPNGWRPPWASVIGLAVAWLFFYLIGQLLILIPSNLHNIS